MQTSAAKYWRYARTQARSLALDQRVEFKVMDALRILEFPTSSFDLVNQRLGVSWLRTWDWTKILLEYLRVTRPGGIIRITEGHVHTECNSPALTKLNSIALDAFYHSGRLWTLSNDGMTRELVRLLTQYGIEDVETRVHALVYRAGTESGQYFHDDIALLFRLFLPFFQKWTRVPDDYQQIYQEALKEMQAADFVATWTALTVWGIRPRDGRPMFMRGLR